jgi:hypothetical protein
LKTTDELNSMPSLSLQQTLIKALSPLQAMTNELIGHCSCRIKKLQVEIHFLSKGNKNDGSEEKFSLIKLPFIALDINYC